MVEEISPRVLSKKPLVILVDESRQKRVPFLENLQEIAQDSRNQSRTIKQSSALEDLEKAQMLLTVLLMPFLRSIHGVQVDRNSH